MNNFKKYLLTNAALALLIGTVGASVVTAQFGPLEKDAQNLNRDANRMAAQASNTAQRQQNDLNNLKKRADNLIATRIASLQKLLARISADNRLTSDEKNSLTSDVQNSINGLNQLKAKIDGDTTVQDVRSDSQQIFTNYRIYEVYEPKVRLLIAIDNLQALSTRMATIFGKLQNLLNNLQSQGKNVTDLQNLLNDANSRLSSINTTLSSDKTTVLGINTSTTNPQAMFVQVRQDLAQNVRAQFAQIRHDIGQMRDDFKAIFSSSSSTPNASATPTSSSSVTPSSTP
jgi:hypothetical protein